jgi:predicted TIM-barrel fold metal-dependent hydrolase
MSTASPLPQVIDSLRLVDHHVHGALRADVDRATFEQMITESDRPAPAGTTQFDSQIGFSIRRWCAPLLDLAVHSSPEDYLARRQELGTAEVNRRFLLAAGVDHFVVETGHDGDAVLGVAEMADVTGVRASEVVRLEQVAEAIAADRPTGAHFTELVRTELATRAAAAVGFKSVLAYRTGFALDPSVPADADVVAAANRWIASLGASERPRLADPVLIRFLLGTAVDLGKPLQLHVGYGDPDLDLHASNPLLLTPWLRTLAGRGVNVLLLHCYPFHREAGYLAEVFPHVYFDVGLALNYVGARAEAVLAESLEVAPFAKQLFSSDAWGPAELHYLGALRWRRACARVLGRWVDEGEWSHEDAVRVATMIGASNARRVYGLG